MSKISAKNVALAIYAAAKGKSGKELEHTIKNSVEFLARKNLLSRSPEILENLETVENDDQNIVRAKVATPRKLSKHTADEVGSALKKRYKADIVLDLTEDPSLLGGIRIEARDEVIDLSLKNKVAQLQNYLLSS